MDKHLAAQPLSSIDLPGKDLQMANSMNPSKCLKLQPT